MVGTLTIRYLKKQVGKYTLTILNTALGNHIFPADVEEVAALRFIVLLGRINFLH
jgi:hypothetical protein